MFFVSLFCIVSCTSFSFHLTNVLHLLLVVFCSVHCKLQKFNLSVEQIKDISERSQEFVDKLFEESKKLEDFASQADQTQMNCIAEFKKAYEVIM